MEGTNAERDAVNPGPPGRSIPTSACQITFGGMEPSEAPRIEVRAWLEKLGALTAPMIAGHVVIDAVDESRKGRLYRVRMELVMPEGVVLVGPDHPSNGAHEDVYVAIRNAFRAARRQLQNHFRIHGLEIASTPNAPATEVLPDLGGV